MNLRQRKKISIICSGLIFGIFMINSIALNEGKELKLDQLLPDLDEWIKIEESQTYYPESLFEYINGAAEIYLSYDFEELIVSQYEEQETKSNVAIEIYDMGANNNAFGIYSAERYPKSSFLNIGLQGYIEEGALNFLAGKYYIKLLCFDCKESSDEILIKFAEKIVVNIDDKGRFPLPLTAFPSEGRIKNTEKYIKHNFMGYAFLHDGYSVVYENNNMEFECFLIEGDNPDDARIMLKKFLQEKKEMGIKEILSGYMIRDRYYKNIFIAQINNYICGVIKIEDGMEEGGKDYLGMIIDNLKQ
jgi:hypothetical protein